MEKRKSPRFPGRADKQTIDDGQPGNLVGRKGSDGGIMSDWHQVQVESVTERASPRALTWMKAKKFQTIARLGLKVYGQKPRTEALSTRSLAV